MKFIADRPWLLVVALLLALTGLTIAFVVIAVRNPPVVVG